MTPIAPTLADIEPPYPRPSNALIEAAVADLSAVMADKTNDEWRDTPPFGGSGMEYSDPARPHRAAAASSLSEALVGRQHGRPAAAWAIYEAVRLSLLNAVVPPTVVPFMLLDRDPTILPPTTERPVPYEYLLVTSTDALWEKLRNPDGRTTGKRRGRTPDTDPKKDQRIFDAWTATGYAKYDDLARELGESRNDVKKAIDRHKKRMRSAPE